jgi:hypothetical protein
MNMSSNLSTGTPTPEKSGAPPTGEVGEGERRVEEVEVPATVVRLPRCIRYEAICPICGIKIRVEEYSDKQGFHAGSKSWGTRKCKHFYAFRSNKAVFVR